MIISSSINVEGFIKHYIAEIEHYEEFLNQLVIGLNSYAKAKPGMTYKIDYDGDSITVKKFYRVGSSN